MFKYFSMFSAHNTVYNYFSCRVFSVIAYATVAFGRSASMVPNYSRAKEASLRIMRLNARQSLIDPDNEQNGRILVNFISTQNKNKLF